MTRHTEILAHAILLAGFIGGAGAVYAAEPVKAAVAKTALGPKAGVVNGAVNARAVLPGSSLGFTAVYQGESFTGVFKQFTPVIRFDPKNLNGSSIDVAIPLGAVDTKNTERDELLVGADFFRSASQPQARYVAKKFVLLQNGRFRADGVLSLRGVSKTVPLIFTWTETASGAVLQGQATVNRMDFGVGTGDWADLELLPNAVTVRTTVKLGQ